jgi:hypothetical protein
MIEPSKVQPIKLGSSVNTLIEKDGNFYYFSSVPDTEEMSKILYEKTSLLEGDEIISEPGIYTYVVIIDPNNKEPKLYAKRIFNKLEISTRHHDILINLKTHQEKEHFKRTGEKIDVELSLLYAGELIVKIEQRNTYILFNFMSGSYMYGVIDPKNPEGNDIRAMHIFQRDIGDVDINGNQIVYQYMPDMDTFITSPVSEEFIREFLSYGSEIYKLDKEKYKEISKKDTITYKDVNNLINNSIMKYGATIKQINNKYDTLARMKHPNEEGRIAELSAAENLNLFKKVFFKEEPTAAEELPSQIHKLKSSKGGKRYKKTKKYIKNKKYRKKSSKSKRSNKRKSK